MSEQNEQRVFIAVVILLLSLSTNCNPKENYPSGLTFQKIDHNFISIDWSPDSKRLVGTTMPNSGSGINIGFPGSEVYVWEPGSDSYEQVSDEAETRWNSDASADGKSDEIIYEVQGALNRLDWSPDGRWITFKDSTQNRDVVAIRLEDKCLTEPLGLEAITGSSVSISDIKWSPNGELIAVIGVRNRQKGVFYIETASNVVEDWLETATCN